MNKNLFLIWITLNFIGCVTVFAQTEKKDDLASSDEKFQDAFYEALTQKGIENYDKALESLEKCLKIQPESHFIFNEFGRNYLAQKNYKKAYEFFEKAATLEPKNRWYWVGMYDVCYETKDYKQSILIVKKLIEFKKEYKEDLVSLYMKTQQFDMALALINELNETVGKSEKRDNLKFQILRDPKYQGNEITNLEEQIKKYPNEESNYLSLIFLYNKNNQEEKADAITKKMAEQFPNSEWSKISLFKVYLKNNEGEKVIECLNTVLKSPKIDFKIKHRMLNEFILFIKDKPQYDKELESVIPYFETDNTVEVAKEIGKFYQNKQQFDKAIRYYEIQLKKTPEDLETIILLFPIYANLGKFDTLQEISNKLLQVFPSQPQLYYYSGLSLNQLKNYKKAKDTLEAGIDFVVSDIDLEINFYIQIGEAYSGLGNIKKKEEYFLKAEQLISQKKK